MAVNIASRRPTSDDRCLWSGRALLLHLHHHAHYPLPPVPMSRVASADAATGRTLLHLPSRQTGPRTRSRCSNPHFPRMVGRMLLVSRVPGSIERIIRLIIPLHTDSRLLILHPLPNPTSTVLPQLRPPAAQTLSSSTSLDCTYFALLITPGHCNSTRAAKRIGDLLPCGPPPDLIIYDL